MFGGNFFNFIQTFDRLDELALDLDPAIFTSRQLRQKLAHVDNATYKQKWNLQKKFGIVFIESATGSH